MGDKSPLNIQKKNLNEYLFILHTEGINERH
jgi:hypothetical protein